MKEQNFKNHARVVAGFHGLTFLFILLLLTGSIITFVHTKGNLRYAALLLILTSVIFSLLAWYTRAFALRAQDRAIRAEENFRHFILTGKPLDKLLRMGQIIALRFASDEEFPALAKKAVDEKLSQKQIKEAVQN